MADQSWTVTSVLVADDKLTPILKQVQAAAAQVQTTIANMMNGLTSLSAAERDVAASGQSAVAGLQELEQALLLQTTAAQNNTQALRGLTDSLSNLQNGTANARRAGKEAQEAMEGLSFATVGARRELLVLIHEFMTGNLSRMPGSLMVLAERMGGLSGATMGAAIGFGLLSYGGYELVSSLLEADKELQNITNHMLLIGGGTADTRKEVEGWVDELTVKFGLSGDAARALVNAIVQSMPAATEAAKKTAMEYAALLAKQEGLTEPKDVGKWAAQLGAALEGDIPSMQKLSDHYRILSAEGDGVAKSQRDQIDIFGEQGKKQEALGIFTEALTKKYGALLEAFTAYNIASKEASSAPRSLMVPEGDVDLDVEAFDAKNKVKTAQQDIRAPSVAADDSRVEQQALIQTTERTIQQLRATWTGSRDEFLRIEAERWQGVVERTTAGSNAQQAALRELAKVQAEQVRQSASDWERGERDKLAVSLSTGTLTRTQELRAQIALDDQLLASDKLTSDRKKDIASERVGLLTQLGQTERAEQLRALQEQVSDAQRGSEEKIAAAKRVLDYAKQAYGANSSEGLAASRAVIAAEREQQAEQNAIARSDAQTSLEVSRTKLQAERDRLDEEVRLGNITVAQKYAALRDLAQKEAALNEFVLNGERATLQDQPAAMEAVNNKIVALKAQLNADLSKLNRDQTKDELAEFDKRLAGYRQMNSQLSSAASSFVSGVLRGQQTLTQQLLNLGDRLIADYVKDQVETLLIHHETEAAKTAATAAGTATRSGIENNGSILGKVASWVVSWVGMETQKTGITEAATAARATIEESTEAARATTSYLSAVAQITQMAPVAAAATFASTAAIPIVGPELAPEAAAAAEATVMSMAAAVTPFSARGGWDRVPFDGAKADLHQDEMVLSARYANPLRNLLDSFPSFALPQAMSVPAFSLPDMSGVRAQAMGNVANNVRNSHTNNHFYDHSTISVQTGDSPSEWLRKGGGEEIHRFFVNKRRNFGL
ncbi:hypothetical protein VPG91_11435 [Nitrospirillum amazonense]|uniref:hypothetical protein n=1 Tax=Nitrospirillum amazonense TaxID=28077 RepID=UPI002DD4214D|nr:hypothetical protein [Nitrospirillum amazonense]MEC4591601.1 hypothetical protein [Nitrospirillum amazonense]